jgi:signal transduction histidine kinase
MAAAADAMARGDYGRRVTATSRDEVGDLARAFNAMAAELAEVDRLRRDLVANASHELRTPIASLQAVLENLADGVEPASPTALRGALEQVERLGGLVSQLLDLSRLEAGTVPLEHEPVPLHALLTDVASDMQRQSRAVAFEVDVEPRSLIARADPTRLRQVLTNLVSNAVRHSPDGGCVRLSARPLPAGIRLAVDDDGPGIPSGDEQRIFERFYRSDQARASRDGGSGLGLAITKWIVDLHGGTVRPESLGRGCRMIVELPER